MLELYNTYSDNVIFVSVSIESLNEIELFNNEYPMSWDFGKDDGTLWAYANIPGTPTTILIDKGGGIMGSFVGSGSKISISDAIDKYLPTAICEAIVKHAENNDA